jgi:DNA repair protein RecO (recombination protein O)
MPIECTEAIVLRSLPVGEQDKLVILFSRDKGLLRGRAKGARKFGNRFGSSLEPMSHVKVFYYEKERQDLVTISQCDLIESFLDLQADFNTSCVLSYWAELAEEFYPARVKEEPLFRLLLACLKALAGGGDRHLLSRYYEVWLLRLSGLLPDSNRCLRCRHSLAGTIWLSPKRDGFYCDRCASEKKELVPSEIITLVNWTKKSPPPEKGDFPLTPEQAQKIAPVIRALLVYHLEKEPRSWRFLKA